MVRNISWVSSLIVSLALGGISVPALAGEVARENFGALADGTAVAAITLTNGKGVKARIITYGAALQSLELPDARGRKADVVLGHATLAEYVAKREFMGAIVGRVANRIAGGRFTLDGTRYGVPANDGDNALHGGPNGFDRVVWEVIDTRSSADFAEVTLRHISPDGDQGFPGRLESRVRYRLGEDNSLSIDIDATTDRPTVVNLSNHAYWNLAGEASGRSALDMVVEIPAATFLPVDKGLIPTGEHRPVKATPFDFTRPTRINARVRDARDGQIAAGRGYDHNWIVTAAVTPALHLMVRVTDPVSGRGMELWSDQPGLQFYSGNFLDGISMGKSDNFYRQGDAIVLEPQGFPDTVNQPGFGSARLAPGAQYRNRMVYRFTGTLVGKK